VFGTILTWMQEKTSGLCGGHRQRHFFPWPPSCCAKAALMKFFFLDLPTLEERKEIISVHLRKRSRQPQDYIWKS
jgi:SpoVK/Ycf46/Vps4 family AAA+-type ATPase